VPTAALVLIGTLLGDLLRHEAWVPGRKATALMAGGVGLAVLGWLWNLDLPFNKPLWTGSYILFSAGCGSALMGLVYLATDVSGWRLWAFPLAVFGSNAIVAYVAPILLKAYVLQAWQWKLADGSLTNLQDAFLRFCVDHTGRIPGGWLYTFAYIIAWWLVLLLLHRKRVFVRA
jgi:predicted acyltransferase